MLSECMIKTIFFDFDGVLTLDDSGSHTTCTNIQKCIPDVTFDHILQCYRVHHPKLLLGQTTHAAVWEDFCACVGKKLDFNVLEQAFSNTPANLKMMDLCKKLKARYTLGIITDNSRERLNLLKERMKLPDTFEIIIVSGETGVRKDSDTTFTQALKRANCRPDECVFVDNTEANLIIPRKLGWNTIFHDSKKNDMDFLDNELKKIGIVSY
jgi:HAD superfamily hydrolase (TIGR01509 family)